MKKSTLFIAVLLLVIILGIGSKVTIAARTSVVQPTAQTTNGVMYFDGTNVNNGAFLTFVGNNLGIGTTTPWGLLSVLDAPANINSTAFVIASSTSAFATTTLFQVKSSGQIVQGGIVPTIATSTGAGVPNATSTIVGNGNFQTITITSGSAPVANATIATITLPSACPTAIVPVFSPGNASSSQIATSTKAIVASSTSASTYILQSGNTGLIATTSYIWNVFSGCY